MHRINTPGNFGGMFVPPNPLTGQQAVGVNSSWLNDVQENIVQVILAAGIALVEGNYGQLLAAIQALITARIGSGGSFGSGQVFESYLSIDGPAGTYRTLFYTTSGGDRWGVNASNGAESGGNAGSDYHVDRYSDAAALIDTPFRIERATGLAHFLDGLTMDGGALTLAADPTSNLHAATKHYVDSIAQGLRIKPACRAATTANLGACSGLLTIDGVALSAGDRVLVKNQTTQAQNGIYIAAAGAWALAPEFSVWADIPGAYAFVLEGSQADTGWVCGSDAGGTLGGTPVTWFQAAGIGTYTADGSTLTLAGNTFSIAAGGVATANLALGAVTTATIAAGAVTNAKIAAGVDNTVKGSLGGVVIDMTPSQLGLKQWAAAYVTVSGGATVVEASGVSTVTRSAAGIFDVTLSPAMPDANYVMDGSSDMAGLSSLSIQPGSRTANGFTMQIRSSSGAIDPSAFCFRVVSIT